MDILQKQFEDCINREGYHVCVWMSTYLHRMNIDTYFRHWCSYYASDIEKYAMSRNGEWYVYFHNGSWIRVIVTKESFIGTRCHYSLVEESVEECVFHYIIRKTMVYSYKHYRIEKTLHEFPILLSIAEWCHKKFEWLNAKMYYIFMKPYQYEVFEWFNIDELNIEE